MANEIKALEGTEDGRYSVLFLYPVEAPKTYPDGAGVSVTVVPTPAPTEGVIASLLSLEERTALDTGAGAFEVVPYGPSPAKTGAELVAELRALYAARKAAFDAAYATRYKYLGQEITP